MAYTFTREYVEGTPVVLVRDGTIEVTALPIDAEKADDVKYLEGVCKAWKAAREAVDQKDKKPPLPIPVSVE